MNPLPDLSDLLVIEYGHVVAAPYASLLLSDLGARVIKIEPPYGDDLRLLGPPFVEGESTGYWTINRDKEGIVIDLTKKEGIYLFKELLSKADVFIHNYRPAFMKKLDLDYQSVKTSNPKLIYCIITGFGENGPYSERPGLDLIFQAMSGLMGITGEPGGKPMRSAAPIADIAAALYAVYAILASLYTRQKTGKGTKIEVSLLDATIALTAPMFAYSFGLNKDPERRGNGSFVTLTDVYQTNDGYVAISISSNKFWKKLCDGLGLQGLGEDRSYDSNEKRVRHQEELRKIIEEKTLSFNTESLLNITLREGIPAGPIYNMSEVLHDEQVKKNRLFFDLELPGGTAFKHSQIPVKYNGENVIQHTAAPSKGKDTIQVLREVLGCDTEEIESLKEKGVV